MEYEKMLKIGRGNLPKTILKTERFEVPRVKGHIQGNKTIISNFHQIANTLRRKPEHLLKYILKELATPGDLKKNALIVGRKISASRLNEKIEQYVNLFVLCRECKKPDTKLEKENSILFIKCMACGAKHPLSSKI